MSERPKRKAPYYEHAPNRPALPPELWQRIFGFASSLDKLLDVDLVGSEFPHGTVKGKDRLKGLRGSLMTRARIITLQWTKRIIPLITRLTTLNNTTRSSTGAVFVGPRLASYVKRLDVIGCIAPALEAELCQNLMRLFSNVQILTIAAHFLPGDVPCGLRVHLSLLPLPSPSQRQPEDPSQSLQALVWYTHYNWETIAVEDLNDLLQTTPNLRVLRWHINEVVLSSLDKSAAKGDPAAFKAKLPYLHTLRLPCDALLDPWLLSQEYPSLTKLTCIPNGKTPFYSQSGRDGWKNFIQHHGRELKHLELQLQRSSSSNIRTFELIRQHCPNVIRIDVFVLWWTSLPLNLSLPSSVTTLGISVNSYYSDGDPQLGYTHLLEVIEELDAPGLQVVQLLAKVGLYDLRRHNLWDKMRTSLAKRDVAIQDHAGSVFVKSGLPSSQGSTGSSKGKERAVERFSVEPESPARDDRLWVDIHEPRTEAELAVHMKKVEDVRRWFQEAFEGGPSGKLVKYRRILALTGPAGTGKTATIRVLARELGFEIMEWRSSIAENTMGVRDGFPGDKSSWMDSDVEYESLFTKFQTFLQRASSCRSLFASTTGLTQSQSTSSKGSRHIILLEDLPNILHEQTQAQFHAALESLVRSENTYPPIPIVIIVSDAGVRGEANEERMTSGYGWSRDRDGVVDIRTVLPKSLLNGPYATAIGFNPIAPTLMKRALQTIVNTQFAGRSGAPSKEILDAVVESSNGDIRSALMALQFACIGDDSKSGGRRKKSTMSTAVLEVVTRREQSLALFHLIGKVLYNKRKGDPPSASMSAKAKQKEQELDALIKDPPKLPLHLQEHERRASRVDVDSLYTDSSIDSSLFSLYIQQNYPQFCNEVDECGDIAEWLSWVDSNGGEAWYQGNPYRFHIVAMGTLHSLPSPVARRSQTVTKPDFFEVLNSEKQAWDSIRDTQSWLVGQKVQGNTWSVGGWNRQDVAVELGGVLKALDSCGLPRTKPPKSHRTFSSLPFSRDNTSSRSKALSPDDVEMEYALEEEGERGTAALKVGESAGGWLESDDIEEF
ncbi:hypothetical protein AX16_005082 [Volvariella volvacea WC 439]|nr:hypothetical protein AX16_005082 [Volvariella volvacea WC 439]